MASHYTPIRVFPAVLVQMVLWCMVGNRVHFDFEDLLRLKSKFV